MLDINSTVTSSLFFGNEVLGGVGAGGGISINTSDSSQAVVSFMNTTFAENSGALATDIANWAGVDAVSNTTFQNCIFSHDTGTNYAVEGGTPEFTSNGGNLCTGDSMADVMTHDSDIQSEDPEFVDPDDFIFALSDGSVAIDAGIDAGAPTTDMNGNPRINKVDIGALENQNTVDVKETIVDNNGQLALSPNPVFDTDLKATLTNKWLGDLNVRVFNNIGQLVYQAEFAKNQESTSIEIPSQNLRVGMYQFVISNGEEAVVSRFVKL